MAQEQEPTFGSILRRLRQAAGCTQEELAERAGLSARAVSALERGVNRTPQRATLEALLTGLGPRVDAAILRAAARRTLAAKAAVDAAPEIRYAASGELSIAYQVEGAGPPDLILVPGLVSHLEQNRQWPGAAQFFQRLAACSRLIRFDKRGTGMSDRVAGVADLEERMDDVRAVFDAARSTRAVVMGQSEGGPMSVLFAATYPERTLGLVLSGAFVCSGSPDRPAGPIRRSSDEDRREMEDIRARFGSREFADEWLTRFAPSMAGDAHFRQYWAGFLRQGASPGAFLALQRMNRRIDVRELLSSVRVPTLILHRAGDRIASVEQARFAARRIPGAKLLVLPGDDHLTYVGDTAVVAAAVQRFIGGLQAIAEPGGVLATVLAVATTTGPDEEAATREAFERFRGRELEGSSNGVLLGAFDGPGRAIRCAQALLATVGPTARAAVQIGECQGAGNALTGPALRAAAAAAREAMPGEILVSGIVRDLVVDPSLRYHERRPYANMSGGLFAVSSG